MNELLYEFSASRHSKGWIGCYQTPKGVKVVRDEKNILILFEREIDAVQAAQRTFMNHLNRLDERPHTKSATVEKVFKRKSGKKSIFETAQNLFRRK